PIHNIRGDLTFSLITPLGAVPTSVLHPKDADALYRLVDARVRLRGVFSTAFTNDGVLTGYRLFVDSEDHIEVLRPAPGDSTHVVPKPIKSLLRFSGDSVRPRRTHVRGPVTFNDAGSLYLDDETGSIHVPTVTLAVRPGDVVDAIGYPTPSEHGPTLADASVEPTGERVALAPRQVTPEEVLNGNLDNRFVSIDARVLSQGEGATQHTLV